MPTITRLPHISPDVLKKLRTNKVKTTDALWRRIGEQSHAGTDAENFDAGVQKVAEDLGLQCDDVKAILIKEEWLEAHPPEHRWRVLIPVLLVVVALAGVRAFRFAGSRTLIEQVVSTSELAAFQVIEPADVTHAPKPATNEGVREIPTVVGRYLLAPVGKDQVIQDKQLSAVTLDASSLQDRVIVSIPLASSSITPNVMAGAGVELVFSPRAPSPDGRLIDPLRVDAIVLKLDDQKGSLIGTFAIMRSSIDAVAKALATSDIYIVQPAP
jgi:hypothetical protein